MKKWIIVFCTIACCTFSYSQDEIEVGNVDDPADCGCYFDKAGDEVYDLILFWGPYEVETHMNLNKKIEILKAIESIPPNLMMESNIKFKIGNDRYSVSEQPTLDRFTINRKNHIEKIVRLVKISVDQI